MAIDTDCQNLHRLDWIGLDWFGLNWIGLDWIGLATLLTRTRTSSYLVKVGTSWYSTICNRYSLGSLTATRLVDEQFVEFLFLVQSKPVYSNHFFAAKNGKKEPIVRKKINKTCEFFIHQEKIISKKTR